LLIIADLHGGIIFQNAVSYCHENTSGLAGESRSVRRWSGLSRPAEDVQLIILRRNHPCLLYVGDPG
jgi:hypothetical protein